MVECEYRIPVEKTKKPNDGIGKALSQAVGPSLYGNVSGQFKQTFECGLCQILTANDIGPMECRQPNKNEKTCPDINHLR